MMRGVPAGPALRCRLPAPRPAVRWRLPCRVPPAFLSLPLEALEPPLWTERSACARNFLVTEWSGISSPPALFPVPKNRVFVRGFVTGGVTGAARGLARYKRQCGAGAHPSAALSGRVQFCLRSVFFAINPWVTESGSCGGLCPEVVVPEHADLLEGG